MAAAVPAVLGSAACGAIAVRSDPAGAVHYETIGVIQGMQHLPATFTPGPRIGDGLDETVARMQVVCDEQRLAEPVTVRKGAAKVES